MRIVLTHKSKIAITHRKIAFSPINHVPLMNPKLDEPVPSRRLITLVIQVNYFDFRLMINECLFLICMAFIYFLNQKSLISNHISSLHRNNYYCKKVWLKKILSIKATILWIRHYINLKICRWANLKIKAASRNLFLTSCETNNMLVSFEMLEPISHSFKPCHPDSQAISKNFH